MPLSIDQIPIPVPSSTDPANFSSRGDAVFGAFPGMITQTNALASEQANNRDLAEASKNAAALSEVNAATYAANATTSSNNANTSSVAALWVSGTTYAINDKRVSPITGQVYRRKTAGAGTTDPSLDSTNWYAVLLDADTQYPSIKPTLNLDFANSGKLDPRITFTRASTATYYDGRSFAKAEENLLTYSQEFDNAAWLIAAGTATKTANTTTAPDGTSTADTIAATSTNATVWQTYTPVVGLPYSGSIYIKRKTGTGTVELTVNGSTYSSVDLSGGGWVRASSTYTATSGTKTIGIRIATSGDEVYVWGAQLEQRSSATAYVLTTTQPIAKYQSVLKTASNNEARFDYDPITLEAKGLLIEESRQNLLTYSEQFDNAAWVKSGATITANTVVSPDGTIDADKLIPNSGVSGYAAQVASISNATAYTFSVFAKMGEHRYVQLNGDASSSRIPASAYFDLQLGVVSSNPSGTASITSVGNGWYRCSVTATSTSTGAQPFVRTSVNGSTPANGDGYSGIYIWGAQLEAGAFPTSYIPTTTAQATRAADAAVMTGTNFSSWYRADEGTAFVEGFIPPQVDGAAGNYYLAFSDGTNSNLINIVDVNGTRSQMITSGVTQFDQAIGAEPTSTVKAAVAYKTNDSIFCVAGTIANSADTSVVLPVVNSLTIGNRGDNNPGTIANGTIKRLAYYPKRLPDYQLQILTK